MSDTRIPDSYPDETPEQVETPVPPGDAGGEAEASDQLRIRQLEEELQASENRFLRAVADFDNYRKRQASSIYELGREEKKQLILDLLDLWDNFQRALDHPEALPSGEFQAGIRSIARQLAATLEKHGASRIECAGQKFDPNFHEVLDVVPVAGRDDTNITRVYKDGFLFQGKLLRPALVQVTRQEGEPDGSQ